LAAKAATPFPTPTWRAAEVHLLARPKDTLALDVRNSRLHRLNPAEVAVLQLRGQVSRAEAESRLAAQFGSDAVHQAVDSLVKRDLLIPVDTPPAAPLPRGPLTRLELGVAEDCNLRCPYCFVTQGSFGGTRRVMTLGIAERAIDLLFSESGDAPQLHIGFYGGEPLLNTPVVRAAISMASARAEAAGKAITFDLITNGTRLTPELVQFFRAHRVGVQISLDGPPPTNDALRPKLGGQGSYKAATVALPMFKDYPALQGRATLTRGNAEADRVVEHLLELGMPGVAARPVVGAEGGLGLDEPSSERVVEGFRRLATRCLETTSDTAAARRAVPFLAYFSGLLFGEPRQVPCKQLVWAVACAADGTLYPCKDMSEKAEYQIGTVATGIDWAKAYDTTTGKLLCQQQAPKKAECATCWGRELCQISCMHVCLEPKGELSGDDPRYSGWECWTQLAIIETALDLFDRLRSERPGVFWALMQQAQAPTASLVAALAG
jgi:uncharacterized protein